MHLHIYIVENRMIQNMVWYINPIFLSGPVFRWNRKRLSLLFWLTCISVCVKLALFGRWSKLWPQVNQDRDVQRTFGCWSWLAKAAAAPSYPPVSSAWKVQICNGESPPVVSAPYMAVSPFLKWKTCKYIDLNVSRGTNNKNKVIIVLYSLMFCRV